MHNYLDKAVSRLQAQLKAINDEAASWKTENEEKLNNIISSQTSDNSSQLKELNQQLEDFAQKKSTIRKYYAAYFEDASPGVQKSTACQPVPVNMGLYKNQLMNPNHIQAADNIITMARSNLEYIRIQEEELKSSIEALESGADNAKKELGMLDTELRNKFGKKYCDLLTSEDVIQISEQCSSAVKISDNIEWDSFTYEPPAESASEVMVGFAERKIVIPEYVKDDIDLKNDKLEVPVYLPVNSFNMLINYHTSQSAATKEGVRTLTGNILRTMAPGTMRIYPIDLETFNGTALGGLNRLAGPAPAFMAPVPTNEAQVLKILTEIYKDAVKVSQKVTGYRSIYEYNAEAPEDEKIPGKIIVLYGFPERVTKNELEYLERIYYMAEQCGISIIAVHNSSYDSSVSSAHNFFKNMKNNALMIDCTEEGQFITCDNGEKAPFRWLQGLHNLTDDTVEAVRQAYGAAAPASEESGKKIADYFSKINHTRGNRRLNLAFGVDEDENIKKFDFEEMNFAAYISGSAGCGKSTLMHTLITGILLNYHPEDIELWLVDFKMTEFQLYAKHMPPHVKRVILESSEEVVLDLIDELTEILEKRTKLFSKYGFKDILHLPEEFRMKHLPLIVVMADEFATMTQIIRNAPASGNLSYAEKLENLMAKGRALGFRFIFADQAYEAGVHGLTTKAKNQIGQRFAMSNVSHDEMRGTLALPPEANTEQVKQWIATLPPHYTLTSEKEAIEGTLENIVRVHRSKVAFVPTERITEIINQLKEMYSPVASSGQLTENTYMDKQPIVVDGQRVYSYKESEPGIKEWDASQDYPEEILRLYMGKPCALRKESPVELKPAPGENLLLVAETPDMVASEVMSAVRSVISGGTRVTILADHLDPFYRMFRHRWEKYNCLTDMEDICTKISQLRQKVEKNQAGNELIVMLGVYNLFQQWEELPERKTAPADLYSSNNFVKPVKMTAEPSPLVSLFSDMMEEPADDGEFERLFEQEETHHQEVQKELSYNAIDDFKWLLTKAPAKGYHFMAVLSQYTEYREMKWSDKMFRHLIYQWLAKDELADIIGYGRSARIPAGALRYVNKKDAFSLRPYLWSGLTINGWTMDKEGNVSEAANEDDEFI